MSFINKVERKFGRYAIKNLTIYLLAGYAIGLVLEMTKSPIYEYIVMDPRLVMKGQVWRLFTWILTPPQEFNMFIIFMFLFFSWIGSSLERAWGSFRYNMYIFSGIIFMTVGVMACYFILRAVDPELENIIYNNTSIYNTSTYYINMTSFLAFALCFPDVRVLFMFVIPIKIKWLAVVDLVYFAYEFLSYGSLRDNLTEAFTVLGFGNGRADVGANMFIWSARAMLVIPLLNYFIFFFVTRNYKKVSPKEIRRKSVYKKQVREASGDVAKHKCAICGRTEKDGEDLVFRFCSKCNGNYEYCQEHLFTHEHK